MGVTVAGEVLVQEDGGEAFLLHVDSGRYFGLNRTGLVIWQAIVAGADPVVVLHERWPSIAVEQCRADVDALIGRLTDAGLVHRAPTHP